MSSVVRWKVSLDRKKLNTHVQEVFDEKMQDMTIEVSGLDIRMERNGNIDLSMDQNQLSIDLPLKVHLKKPSGLFTVEGEGEVSVKLQSLILFDKQLNIHPKTELLDHMWQTKPTLQLGVLSMPIQTLINLIIEHSQNMICAKIDAVIKENVHVRTLLDTYFYHKIGEIEAIKERALFLNASLEKLEIHNLKTDDRRVILDAEVTFTGGIYDRVAKYNYPIITFVTESTPSSNQASIPVKMSFARLKDLILEVSSGMDIAGKKLVIDEFDLFYLDGKVRATGFISSPAEMDFMVVGNLIYDAMEEVASIDDLEIDVKPKNLIYKLIAPAVEKGIKMKLKDLFPMDIAALIKDKSELIPTKIGKEDIITEVKWDRIKLKEIELQEEGISLILGAKDLQLHIDQA